MATNRKWTSMEDAEIIRYVERYPQNLKKCFLMVSEVIDRTPGAVAYRWYSHVSKDPANLCFFTASQVHISPNRKNAEGVANTTNIWNRLKRALHAIGLC